MNLLDKAQAIQGEITEIRRHLHQYPELPSGAHDGRPAGKRPRQSWYPSPRHR